MKPEYIVLHHSLTEDSGTVSWSAIRKYHVNQRKWSGIGYHFGIESIDRHVEILLGRPWLDQGAHCKAKEMNHRSIGVCFVGNYDSKPVPRRMWQAGIRLCATLMESFAIPSIKVVGHREVDGSKTCPGENFDLREFRKTLWERWVDINTI